MQSPKRNGFSLAEMVVACGLMTLLISIVGPSTLIATRLIRQGNETRMLTNELDNQLERLVVMPDDDLEKALDSLRLNDDLSKLSKDASISGERISDQDGERIRLTIAPGEISGLPTMTMTGWRMAVEEENR